MWFWLSLSAAVLSACENILNKRVLGKVDAAVFTWSLFSLSLPFLGYLAFKDGLTSINHLFFLGVTSAAIAFAVSKTITNHVIRQGILSKLMPLMSITVLFSYLIGLIFLSEKISGSGVFGLILIVLGVYVLNADRAKEDFFMPIKILISNKLYLLFILAAFLTSLESIFMKTAMNNTNPLNIPLVMFVEQCVMTTLLTIYLLRYKKGWVGVVRQNFWKLLLNSIFYLIISLLIFSAISTSAVALAQGIKRSQLLFTLILGIIFLNDRPSKHTWAASLLIIMGVILIKIST